jgi:CheY-like chemotaxis protein
MPRHRSAKMSDGGPLQPVSSDSPEIRSIFGEVFHGTHPAVPSSGRFVRPALPRREARVNPVLIVEDNAEIREEILKAEGAEVATAADGAEGLRRLADAPRPCLVLLDLKMPVMDGFEFLERRNREPELAKIPVIMLTGTAELAGREKELNVQGFVRKPFDPAVLMTLVREHCD